MALFGYNANRAVAGEGGFIADVSAYAASEHKRITF